MFQPNTPTASAFRKATSAAFIHCNGVTQNKKQFYIPKNFAHGFYVLSEIAEFAYKCTDFYHPDDEGGLAWDDPDIGIDWPLDDKVELIISEKDRNWGGIKQLKLN